MHRASQVQSQPQHDPSIDSSQTGLEGMGTWMYAVVLLLAAVIFGIGIYLAVQKQGWAMLAAGSVSIVGVLVTWPLATSINQARAAEIHRQEQFAESMSERLQHISVLLNLVSEQQLLSDRAKQVAFREKDRDALRHAIHEDLARRDWEAALALVSDMENTFGYKQEAAIFRDEINKHRQDVVRRQINDVVGHIDTFCRQEKWSEALREAEKLMRLHPANEQVQRLPQEIEARRQGTKRQLSEAWHEALTRKDVDGSIEILKKLDTYLTRQEAESMQEAARGVFKEKLNQLSEQFKLAWRDKNDAEALRIGQIIVRDFPNSGIAREVREDYLPKVRARGGEPELARA